MKTIKRTNGTKSIACMALMVLMVLAIVCAGNATPLHPVSYTGGMGEGNWADPTESMLTDGVIGSDDYMDWTWVGWFNTVPETEIIFDFGDVVNFTSAAVQSLNEQNFGITLVKGIYLTFSDDGINFGNEKYFQSTQAQYATIPGSQSITSAPLNTSGRYVKMTFTQWGAGSWVFLSEVSFQGSLSNAVSGQVVLSDFNTSSLWTMSAGIEFIPQGGGEVRKERVGLDANGNFTTSPVDQGTYDIGITVGQFLRKLVPGVVINGAVTLDPVTLTNGDADGDNEVTSSDLSIMLKSIDVLGDQ